MRKYYYQVLSPKLIGVKTNIKNFNSSFGRNVKSDLKGFEDCLYKFTVILDSKLDLPSEEVSRYSYFSKHQKENGAFSYKRQFLFGSELKLKLENFYSDHLVLTVNYAYYKFVHHRFMNLHSLDSLLADLIIYKLLSGGYSPLYCSSFRIGERTAILFGPPNTGKTLTALMACIEEGGQFISEDFAITDGQYIYKVPWTNSARFYSNIDNNKIEKVKSDIRKYIPFMEFFIGINHSVMQKINRTEDDINLITDIMILGRADNKEVFLSDRETKRRMLNLNRYGFNYYNSPLLKAISYFDENIDINELTYKEEKIIEKTILQANNNWEISRTDPTKYAGIISSLLKANVIKCETVSSKRSIICQNPEV